MPPGLKVRLTAGSERRLLGRRVGGFLGVESLGGASRQEFLYLLAGISWGSSRKGDQLHWEKSQLSMAFILKG